MALKDIKLGVGTSGAKKMSRRSIPVKRSLNLAATRDTSIDPRVAIPAIVLIVLAAALLSKFAVVDRFLAVTRAQNEVIALRTELDANYEELEGKEELSDLYAHYTYSGMTPEEVTRTDRVRVLQLLQKVVIPQAEVSNWSVSGNVLTLNLIRSSLQEVNLLAQQLNENEYVEYCTVTTAATGRQSSVSMEPGHVTAQVLVYMMPSDPEDAGAAASETEEEEKKDDALTAITKTAVNGVAGNITGDLAAGKEALENQ